MGACPRPRLRWVASFATDTPFFPDDLVLRLLQSVRAENADIGCAASGGRTHPVFGLWPVALAAALRRALTAEGVRRSTPGRRATVAIARFPSEPYDPFFNVNEAADLQKAEALLPLATRRAVKLFGLAGWSGSGKTTLVIALLPALIRRGLRVSTVKHVHHSVDLDQPERTRITGWRPEVTLVSASRWTLMHELRGEPEPNPADLLRHMTPVDLLLVEGFKHAPHDKLEVHRPSVGKPLLCRDDRHVVAVASDEKLADLPVPLLSLDDVEGSPPSSSGTAACRLHYARERRSASATPT